ncbi:hypothetical protein R1flu_021694 [Riccia fluitans]|uniref:NAD(P)-binding domain-containing protein n=1 Tax=Riccia fluitans TaxID=41844 RepID=A0ABD1ZQ45_9MARC
MEALVLPLEFQSVTRSSYQPLQGHYSQESVGRRVWLGSSRNLVAPLHVKRLSVQLPIKGITKRSKAVAEMDTEVAVASEEEGVNEDVLRSVELLKTAAKTRKVSTKEVRAAFQTLEKADLDRSNYASIIGGSKSPGRTWMLVYNITKDVYNSSSEDGASFFPITAVQQFDAEASRLENGVYLGPLGSLTFSGKMTFEKRKLSFFFNSVNLTLGSWGPLKIKFGGKSDSDIPDKNDPFFIWYYADDEIIVAKGRGGGVAYWCRIAFTWRAERTPRATSSKLKSGRMLRIEEDSSDARALPTELPFKSNYVSISSLTGGSCGLGICGTRSSPPGEETREQEEEDKLFSCQMAKTGGWTALIVGGTGAIGKYVVAEILKNEKFASVTVLGRREIKFPDEVKPSESQLKRVNYKNFSDPSEMDEWEASDLTPNQYDVAFCCLGTTRKDAGSAEAFRKVDYDGAASFGKLAKKVQVEHLQLVSSQGANRHSMFLYLKTKGETEEFLRSLNFKQYSIFRPPLLDRGTEARTVEKVMKAVMPSIKVHDVARAMVRQAELVLQADSKGEEILGPKDIKKLYQRDANPIPE